MNVNALKKVRRVFFHLFSSKQKRFLIIIDFIRLLFIHFSTPLFFVEPFTQSKIHGHILISRHLLHKGVT